ncbi:MAG: hypothetical protein Q7S44_02965 [bacterium]|nr:hypothetical protein [bacterium]
MERNRGEVNKGLSKDWMKMLREGTITDRDLYDLVDDVIKVQHRENPPKPPNLPPIRKVTVDMATGSTTESIIEPGEPPKGWDSPDSAYLDWSEGYINLDQVAPTNEEPSNKTYFDITSSKGRHANHEYFELRRCPDGSIKAFWTRPEPLSSELLGEDLEDTELEVTLTPKRIERIARPILLAHWRTMTEAGL